MGNEQSAPTPRRRERPPNKLSKPRTNNHSNANLLLDRRASAPPSRRNSVSTVTNGSPTKTKNRDSAILAAALPDEAIEVPKVEPSRKRMSLFRSKSAKPESQGQKLKVETDVGISSVEPSPLELATHRWSREPRRNSVTTQSSGKSHERPIWTEPPSGLTKPPMRSRMSLQTYTHHPRLSLVSELPSPQPQTTIANRRLSRFEQDDGSPGGLSQASRTNSESALYTPIRRRSLLQHGVATRTSFVESDPRSSLPSQIHSREVTPPRKPVPQHMADEVRDYYYNPSKPTSSPLSDLVLLGPTSDFVGIGPRTETPTELEHIGAFKLGTLRITNGAASPAPSFRSSTEDDYISAGNARRSQDGHHGQARSYTLSVPAETRKAPWIVRDESPLRQTHEPDLKPLTIETQLPIISPSFAWFDFEGTEQLFKTTESPTKALELAKDYQQDLALSPFSFDTSPLPSPRVPSPRLESTSKHTAIEDDLFAAEPGTPNLSERAPRSFDSAYDSGFAPPKRLLKGPRDAPPKPLAKADSGYSSNISLRSFKRDSLGVEEQRNEAPSRVPSSTYSVASTYPTNEAPSRVPSSTYSVTSAYSVASADSDLTLRMKRSLPSIPPQDPPPPPPPPMRKAPLAPLSPTFDINKDVPNPPTPDKDVRQAHLSVPPKPQRKSMPSTPSRMMREESPANSEISTTSSNSSSRWSSKSKINKRPQSMQPPKPQPEPVFTVQAFRSPSEQLRIPPPSIEAQRHLDERVETFPVACFPNTFPGHVGLRHSSSKETLGTIFSVGSAEIRDELNFARLQSALPPVPVEPSIPEHPVPKPEFNRRNTFQVGARLPVSGAEVVQRESRPGKKSFQMPKTRDRSLSRTRDRSLPRLPPINPISNEDLEAHLTSYTTVSSSLGKSPYELAASTIPKPQPSSNERAKSMTSQFETSVAARPNTARGNNPEPQQPIARIRSYDSIATTNPSRRSSRDHPPQAHANSSPWRPQPHSNQSQQLPMQIPQSQSPLAAHPSQSHAQQSSNYLPAVEKDEERRFSGLGLGGKGKTRNQPPVSMTTQRKSVPSRPAPPTTQSSPAPSAQTQTRPQDQERGGNGNGNGENWTTTSNTWKSHRQSADAALQTRKSMEIRRPVPAPVPAMQLRGRKSMDPSYSTPSSSTSNLNLTANSQAQQQRQSQPHPLHARRSYDSQSQSQASGTGIGKMQAKGWNVGIGYEDTHSYQSSRTFVDTPPPPPSQRIDQQQEYSHAFGSNKENLYRNSSRDQDEGEFYTQPHFSDARVEDTRINEKLHHSRTSTSEMLALDFDGSSGYGFEREGGRVVSGPGSAPARTAGSAMALGVGGGGGGAGARMGAGGRRKSLIAERWGVDFSDGPSPSTVYGRGVGVEG